MYSFAVEVIKIDPPKNQIPIKRRILRASLRYRRMVFVEEGNLAGVLALRLVGLHASFGVRLCRCLWGILSMGGHLAAIGGIACCGRAIRADGDHSDFAGG